MGTVPSVPAFLPFSPPCPPAFSPSSNFPLAARACLNWRCSKHLLFGFDRPLPRPDPIRDNASKRKKAFLVLAIFARQLIVPQRWIAAVASIGLTGAQALNNITH